MKNRLIIKYSDMASFTMKERIFLQRTLPPAKELKEILEAATDRHNERLKLREERKLPMYEHTEFIQPKVKYRVIKQRFATKMAIESFRCTSRQKAEAAVSKRNKSFLSSVDFYDAAGTKHNIYSEPIL